MNRKYRILIITTIAHIICSCAGDTSLKTGEPVVEEMMTPPVADVIPHEIEMHGMELVDNYHWMKDKERNKQDVIDYVKEENTYTDFMTNISNPGIRTTTSKLRIIPTF